MLGEDWADWFEGFSLQQDEGNVTSLIGEVKDSSDLHGILAKIRDLNLEILSVRTLA
jgi:hypothetical protein